MDEKCFFKEVYVSVIPNGHLGGPVSRAEGDRKPTAGGPHLEPQPFHPAGYSPIPWLSCIPEAASSNRNYIVFSDCHENSSDRDEIFSPPTNKSPISFSVESIIGRK